MDPRQPRPLVLASTSPRRRQLLTEAGYNFEVVDPCYEELDERHPHVDPTLHAESLAYFKARSIAPDCFHKIILAADTIAFFGDEIIGKADTAGHARDILSRLSGTSHQVITGVALLAPATGRRLLQHAVSTIHMHALSPRMIDDYVATGAWRGKAGAYGIQDHGDAFVKSYTGSFSNIVGLPMELVARMFDSWGG